MKLTAKAAGGLYDPYSLKNPFKVKWDQEIAQFNSKASDGINNCKQTAGLDWCLMITELKFVETMKQGLVISIIFAFIALLAATKNLVMALYASVSIGMILVNVLALIPYMGW